MNSNAALARVDGVEPQTMAELKDFAKMAADSRFFGCDTPQQALIVAMAGKDLGFSYTQALRAFHIVKGKPTLSADGMVAACLARPDACEFFRPVRVSETEAVWVTKPRGADPIEYRFTMEDAQRAGLVNDMYKKHPKRMLSARCKSYLARDVYPQILMGLVTDDEALEIAERQQAPRARHVVAEVVEARDATSVEDAATSIADRMRAAETIRDLTAVAADVKGAHITDEERAHLRDLFAERRAALAPPVAEPAREPGEEG
jgi:hypothetical protein